MSDLDLKKIKDAITEKHQEFGDTIDDMGGRIQSLEQKGAHGQSNTENKNATYSKSDFETFLKTGDKDLLKKSMSIATDAAGGYTHISELGQEIVMAVGEINPLMNEVRQVTISSNVYDQLFTDSHGASARSAESGTRSETSTANFQKTAVTLYDLYAYPKITNELINSSSFNLSEFIMSDIRQQFSEALGTEFVTGTGSNESVGLLNAMSGSSETTSPELAWGSIQYIGTGSPETLSYASLLDVITALPVRYKAGGNAKWYMSTEAIESVRGLLDANNLPIWRQDFGIAGAPMVLLGYPVVEVPQMPAPGSSSYPILFGDMRQAYAFITHQRGLGMIRDDITSPGFTKFYSSLQCAGGVMDSRALRALKF